MLAGFLIFLAVGGGFNAWFFYSLLRKRIDNADARILRLEQVEDRRHAFDSAMSDKATNTIKLRCKPKEDCPDCHGRGHIGKNTVTGLFVPCKCCC